MSKHKKPVKEGMAEIPQEEIIENTPVEEINIFDIESAPKDGSHVILMQSEEDEGKVCYWRKTREMRNFKWNESGKWSDVLTHTSIKFQPKFWREVYA